jgi:hypothetical protein
LLTLRSLPLAETKEVFGDFTPYLSEEGVPSIFWEEEILTQITLPVPIPLAWNKKVLVSKVRCHEKIAGFLHCALVDAHQIPDVWSTINDFGGIYNFRVQRRSMSKLSKHCWGIAIDLDVGDNPFSKKPQVHPKLVEIFHCYGFLWGGNFAEGRKDGMHFEFADLSKIT